MLNEFNNFKEIISFFKYELNQIVVLYYCIVSQIRFRERKLIVRDCIFKIFNFYWYIVFLEVSF